MAPLIRLAEEADAADVLAIYAPVVRGSAISFELEPPSLEEMRERIQSLQGRLPWLVCADGPAIWGYAYADRFRARPAYQWSVEVTVYVSPGRQRRGVARALYTSLLAALRLLGYRNAFAGIRPAQPGQRGPPRGPRLPPRGPLPGGWLQARTLARRGLVEARAAAPRPARRGAAHGDRRAGLPGMAGDAGQRPRPVA